MISSIKQNGLNGNQSKLDSVDKPISNLQTDKSHCVRGVHIVEELLCGEEAGMRVRFDLLQVLEGPVFQIRVALCRESVEIMMKTI